MVRLLKREGAGVITPAVQGRGAPGPDLRCSLGAALGTSQQTRSGAESVYKQISNGQWKQKCGVWDGGGGGTCGWEAEKAALTAGPWRMGRIRQADGSEQELRKKQPKTEIGGIRTPGGWSEVPVYCV